MKRQDASRQRRLSATSDSTVARAMRTISSPLFRALKGTAKFNEPLTRLSYYNTEAVPALSFWLLDSDFGFSSPLSSAISFNDEQAGQGSLHG
jgi:hypothetical protein